MAHLEKLLFCSKAVVTFKINKPTSAFDLYQLILRPIIFRCSATFVQFLYLQTIWIIDFITLNPDCHLVHQQKIH